MEARTAVITLSRQSGSEGNQIARLLRARLGYELFEKNMMLQLGAQMGLRPEEIGDASVSTHQAKSLLERMFASDTAGWTFAVRSEARQAITVAQTRELVIAAYERDKMIIVGRGAQLTLAGKPDALHVRVWAPVEVRIQRWEARARLTAEQARARVTERDRAHADFIKRFFDADIDDPNLYDLVINTGKIAPAAAAELIIHALEALPSRG